MKYMNIQIKYRDEQVTIFAIRLKNKEEFQ